MLKIFKKKIQTRVDRYYVSERYQSNGKAIPKDVVLRQMVLNEKRFRRMTTNKRSLEADIEMVSIEERNDVSNPLGDVDQQEMLEMMRQMKNERSEDKEVMLQMKDEMKNQGDLIRNLRSAVKMLKKKNRDEETTSNESRMTRKQLIQEKRK